MLTDQQTALLKHPEECSRGAINESISQRLLAAGVYPTAAVDARPFSFPFPLPFPTARMLSQPSSYY